MKTSYEIKCEEYTLINGVNDEYLKKNQSLKEQNTELTHKVNFLQRELTYMKVQQLKKAKPFVDLTHDDDSDIEIVSDERKVAEPSEIIELDDDCQPEPQENAKTEEEAAPTPESKPSVSSDNGSCPKNLDANMIHDTFNDLQDFDWILGQI